MIADSKMSSHAVSERKVYPDTDVQTDVVRRKFDKNHQGRGFSYPCQKFKGVT